MEVHPRQRGRAANRPRAGACLTPMMGGFAGARTDFIPNPDERQLVLADGGVVENGGATSCASSCTTSRFVPNQPAPSTGRSRRSTSPRTPSHPAATPATPSVSAAGPRDPQTLLRRDHGGGWSKDAISVYAYGHTGSAFSRPPVGHAICGAGPDRYGDLGDAELGVLERRTRNWSALRPHQRCPMVFIPRDGRRAGGRQPGPRISTHSA